MDRDWRSLGWRHRMWDLLRFYLSIRGDVQQSMWLARLRNSEVGDIPVIHEDAELLAQYLADRETMFDQAFALMRTEEEALAYCEANGVEVGTTQTQNQEHHQSRKALIAAVSYVAATVCTELGLQGDFNPQTRCAWFNDHGLHVTARNLDGAIPQLVNPKVVWEIKEYWGKTKGGSKMSDAVYECNLVGRELREFEEHAKIKVGHVVFLDGRDQWGARKSDLSRFIDLYNAGLIDHLFVGRQVETVWGPTLRRLLAP